MSLSLLAFKAFHCLLDADLFISLAQPGTSPTMNQALSHPTLPIVLTAHDDGHVRILDSSSGKILQTIKAHLETVNSLDIDPSSLTELATAGDDCSCKIWDLSSFTSPDGASSTPSEPPTCIQEWTNHRVKNDQGVLCVRYMSDGNALTTGGGSGLEALMGAASSTANAVSTNGKGGVLVSGGADGVIRIYARNGARR